MRRFTLGVLLCALTFAWPAGAQEQRGAIEGIVKDAQGAVLPGVTVEAKDLRSGAALTSVSDEIGAYRFPAVRPGNYELTFTLTGFNTAKAAADVALGQLKKVDVTLNIAGVAENIQVTAESPLIDAKQNAAFQNIRGELIDKLPRGRDFTSLVTIAPGANTERATGGISIDGASGSENQYVVDGVTTTDLRTGTSAKGVVTDFVEEVQVKSSGYPAEFGGATGGVINVITKSGGNQFRGDAGFYFAGDALEAPSYSGINAGGGLRTRVLRLSPTVEGVAEYVDYDDDKWTRWEPAFTVGGPIARDKVWFFAGYVPTLLSTDRAVTFLSNGTTGEFNRKDTTQNFTGNVQAQASEAIRLKFAMNANNFERDSRLPAADGTSNPLGPFDDVQKQPNYTYSGQLDWVANNRLFFAARGGYLWYDTEQTGIPDEIRYIHQRSSIGMAGVPEILQRARGFSSIPTNSATQQDKYTRANLNFDGTYFATFAGQHTFKGGVQWDRYGNNVLSGEQQPIVQIYWDTGRNTLDGRTNVRGPYGYYHVRQFQTTGDISSNTLGLFFQDQWTVNNRLTINAGLRTESENVPSYTTEGGIESTAIEFGFGDKIAPRLGFAYDIKGDGRWKAYGGWGIFYDIVKLEMPRGAFGGDKWIQNYYTLDTPNWPGLTGDSPALNEQGGWAGTFIESIDYRHPSNSIDANTIDPELDPVKQQEFSLGFDHELTSTMSVGVRYVKKWVNRTIEDVGVIVPGVGEVYFIANPGYGVAKTILPTECNGPCPDMPPAKRDYNGVEFRLRKRLADNWSMNASYLWSRLYGNYSGLANTDESLGTATRTSPNVTRAFDSLYNLFDSNGQTVEGALATDRPHQLKMQGIYDFPFGFTVSGNVYVASGTPMSTEMFEFGIPFFPNGRNDLDRTPTYSQFDLYLQQDFRMPGNTRLQVGFNILNLFDQDASTQIFWQPYQDSLNIADPEFFSGFNLDQAIAEGELTPDARFGLDNGFQNPRTMRLSVKFIF